MIKYSIELKLLLKEMILDWIIISNYSCKVGEFTVIFIDYYVCVEYFIKYVVKGELRLFFLKKVFSFIVINFYENFDLYKVIKKVVMKIVGERDYVV